MPTRRRRVTRPDKEHRSESTDQTEITEILSRDLTNAQRRIVNDLYLDGGTYARLIDRMSPENKETALAVVEEHLAELAPRNAVERLLAVQMLWQHARLARLCSMSVNPTNLSDPQISKTLNAAIEQGMNTYRRQALAWQQIRSPRPAQFIRGGQVNVAEKQVVANGPVQGRTADQDEQEDRHDSPDGRGDAQGQHESQGTVPPFAGGLGVPAGLCSQEQAVGAKHGASDR
jgi:hypothetical protein